MSRLRVDSAIIQEIREWRKRQLERYGKDGQVSSVSWLDDYMNNFHGDIADAFDEENTWHYKTGTMDVKYKNDPETQNHRCNKSETRLNKTAREFYADIRGQLPVSIITLKSSSTGILEWQ